MELLTTLLDFLLHVDVHLANFVQLHGLWVYALLFASMLAPLTGE